MKKITILSFSVFSFFHSCTKYADRTSGDIPCSEIPRPAISFEGYPVAAPADSLNELSGIPGIKIYAPLVGTDLNYALSDTTRTDHVYLVSLPLRPGPGEYTLAEIRDTLVVLGKRNTGRPFVMASVRHMIPVLKMYGTTIRNQSRLIACLGISGTGLGIFNFVIRSSMVSPYISVNAVDTAAGVTYGNQILAIRK